MAGICETNGRASPIWLPINRILEILQAMIVLQKAFIWLPFLPKRLRVRVK